MQSRYGRTILITGGAGFIGSNLAARLLREPDVQVRIFDNLSRNGVEHNLQWLKSPETSGRLTVIRGDVRNYAQVMEAAKGVTEIYHLAAQVAVTTSVDDPLTDFEVNAQGTLHVLEAARRSPRRPFVFFTSTNKVYGGLESVNVKKNGRRYEAVNPSFNGIDEKTPLDFHSPYGCSKGAADQYVHDYARIYGLPTIVFRMSCICGPRQFGTEDQGWVAHFLYSTIAKRSINIYGDGLQVRDVLHIYDLLDAIQAVRAHIGVTRGQVYNLGGGMARAISVLDMLRLIERETGQKCRLNFYDMRPGDQPLYITDFSKLTRDTGWKPKRSIDETLGAIHRFWRENRKLIADERRMQHAVSAEIAQEAV